MIPQTFSVCVVPQAHTYIYLNIYITYACRSRPFLFGVSIKVQEQSEMNQIDTVYIDIFVMNEVHMYSTYYLLR